MKSLVDGNPIGSVVDKIRVGIFRVFTLFGTLEELLERLPQADAEGALERDLERVRQQLASPAWTAATLPSRGRP